MHIYPQYPGEIVSCQLRETGAVGNFGTDSIGRPLTKWHSQDHKSFHTLLAIPGETFSFQAKAWLPGFGAEARDLKCTVTPPTKKKW